MDNNETKWWMLQVQFIERHPGQIPLLSQPLPRDVLLRQCIEMIPTQIRINRGKAKGTTVWGLAELSSTTRETMFAELTVRPPNARIAEEPTPGILEAAVEPRFFTPMMVHVPLQIIAIHRSADVTRFARSANAYAAVLFDLLYQAMRQLDMLQHYELRIEPISKKGSFIEWYKSLEQLNRIIIHYVGPNLPARPDTLVMAIRENAKSFRNTLRSKSVDLIANEPHLTENDVEDLDRAAAMKRIQMRAKGTRSGIGSNWSSSEKLEAETILVSLTDEQLAQPKVITARIGEYLNTYFSDEDRNEN